MRVVTTLLIYTYTFATLIIGSLLPRMFVPPAYKGRLLYPCIGAFAYKWVFFQKFQ